MPMNDDLDRELLNVIRVNSGQEDLVEQIILSGANINGITNNLSPLMLATQKCDLSYMELLVKYGADVNQRSDSNGWPPLMFCATAWHSSAIMCSKFLLDNNANIDTVDSYGDTSLMKLLSLDTFQYEMCDGLDRVKFFVDNGADINFRNEKKLSAINLAKLFRNDDTIEYINSVMEKKFLMQCCYGSTDTIKNEIQFL